MRTEAERADRFVRGLKSEIQCFVLVLRSDTRTGALHMVVDMSLHESLELAKAVEKGTTSGQKRKVEQQPTVAP